MKKKIFTLLFAVVMLLSFSVTVFADSRTLICESSYDADTNTVSVVLSIEDPDALEAADFCLAFNPDVYEYIDYDDSEATDNAMVVAGTSSLEPGLATCSLIFTEACEDSDLNADGNLSLVTFHFKPLTEEYNIDDFCFWATSYSVKGKDVVDKVDAVGNTQLKSDHTAVVTVSPTTSASSLSSGNGTKWYVYVIAGVLAVGAVAGIAFVAIRNNQEENSLENEDDIKKNNTDSSEE